jgi:hypothetical protein
VSLFLPNREWLRFGNALQRWRALATDVEEYRAPAGCKGDDMLLAPQVEAVAELFGRCRDAVEARTAVSARAG